MRRGHPNRPGWRSDGPKHFRPRLGGPGQFRPQRPYTQSIQESNRFPQPGLLNRPPPPFRGGAHFPPRANYRPEDHCQQDEDLRPRRGPRQYHHSPWAGENSGEEPRYYQQNSNDRYQINSLGDIDQRQLQFKPPNNHDQGPNRVSSWQKDEPVMNRRHQDHGDRNNYRNYRNREEYYPNVHSQPESDYPGHRPPSSDHYDNVSRTNIENESFNRSVDDTVNLVRRKLINRHEHLPETNEPDHHSQSQIQEDAPMDKTDYCHQEPVHTPKRPHHKTRHCLKVNCNKMKDNIVNQLFKMDKGKIHKLMDNPNSSSKFEYAINSLVTESKNNLNRHLRSVAEKSLYGNRNDISQYQETDTIYEDTFMKQMQCILDPQDTIMLEDIKPFVLAELNKVLQLDETDFRPDGPNYLAPQNSMAEYENPDYYDSHTQQAYNDCQHENYTPEKESYHREHSNQTSPPEESRTDVLFDRRPERRNADVREIYDFRESPERPQPAFSPEEYTDLPKNTPYFEANAEHLSDDDDYTFAELDKQYHVAVDPNFIEADDVTTSDANVSSSVNASPPSVLNSTNESNTVKTPNIKQEHKDITPQKKYPNEIKIKKDLFSGCIKKEPEKDHQENYHTPVSKKENISKNSSKQEEVQKPDSSSTSSRNRSPSSSKSRKRTSDQRPSHRKEKRKKSDATASDQPILNKNIIINVNDCAKKSSDKCESSGKSIFNLFFSKDDKETNTKDQRASETTEPGYSDKYVKRKESRSSKDKQYESKKRSNSTSSNHSMLSPKENKSKEIQNQATTPAKNENKNKLKTIDIFCEKPKKTSIHAAHRNTAAAPLPVEENKVKTLPVKSISKQITRVSTGIQAKVKVHTKETQTVLARRKITRHTQTDSASTETSTKKSTDAFERMKEIDMEIQVLLQEKFKLYSSLEAKGQECPNSLQTLGMAVLNVSSHGDEFTETEEADAIIEEFTSIPADDLEKIALETVEKKVPVKISPKKTRSKVLQEKSNKLAQTPKTKKGKNNVIKTPNISLIEKILVDDRPIEEIISLEELEESPPKSRSSRSKKVTKNTSSIIDELYKNAGCKKCYVLLKREDLNKLKVEHDNSELIQIEDLMGVSVPVGPSSDVPAITVPAEILPCVSGPSLLPPQNVIHFQDDMFVSEDIVIGDVCEIGKCDDKVGLNEVVLPVSEDIVLDNSQSSNSLSVETSDSHSSVTKCKMYDFSADEDLKHDSITCTGNGDAILAIECIDKNFLAASLDGNVYYFSGDGQLLNTLRGSNLAVTCLTVVKERRGTTTVYTGSLDSRIRYYDLDTGVEKGMECNVLSPIQTMDRAWDTVFVGTRTGFVLQFECKNNMLIPVSTIKFSDQSILALRALKEGPRKVLLVAARSENVTIKDAQTGLLLRTLEGPNMTVYTLLYEGGKVYCGTSSHQIQVFDYASGSHMGTHSGGKGAVCLVWAGGLLLAGCYDGCVYLHRAGDSAPFAQLRGPPVMLLSLARVGTKVIAGYKDRSLYIWNLPVSILQEMVL